MGPSTELNYRHAVISLGNKEGLCYQSGQTEGPRDKASIRLAWSCQIIFQDALSLKDGNSPMCSRNPLCVGTGPAQNKCSAKSGLECFTDISSRQNSQLAAQLHNPETDHLQIPRAGGLRALLVCTGFLNLG